MVAGFELCNAYSEQNDAAAQLAAFEAEARAKAAGRPRGRRHRLRLRARARVRAALHRRPRDRHRPAGHAAVGRAEHPRGDPVPDDAARGRRRTQQARSPGRAPAARSLGSLRPPPAPLPVRRPPARGRAGDRHPDRHPDRAASPSSALLRLLGGFASLGGLIMLLTLVPVLHSRIDRSARRSGRPGSGSPATCSPCSLGLGLLFLAGQLARGKRRAWQLAVVLFALGVVTNILKGPHPLSTAYCAAMVGALVGNRRAFRGAGRPALAVPARAAGAGLRRRRAAVRLHQPDPRTAPPRRAADRSSVACRRSSRASSASTARTATSGRSSTSFFPKALLLLGVVGVLGALYLLFRPLASAAAAHRTRLGPRPRPRPRLRLRHAGLLRAAR